MAESKLLTEESTYKALLEYFRNAGKKISMPALFKEDPDRFKKFRLAFRL